MQLCGRARLGSHTHHFCLHPFGKNLVTWLQLATRELGDKLSYLGRLCAHRKLRASISKIKKWRKDMEDRSSVCYILQLLAIAKAASCVALSLDVSVESRG